MPMLSRYAKPLVVWSFATLAAFAQQPPINQQFGAGRPQQPGAQQAGTQQTAQPSGASQFAPQGQQLNQLAPVERIASANGSNSNGPVNGPGSAAVDRQALEQQMAAQQQALAAQLSKMPFEPLTEPQQKYLDKVLSVWEIKTAAIERYQCNFKRWVFDPSQNSDPDASATAEGAVRFMQPDKGLFRVDKLEFFSGRDSKQAAQYRENDRQKFGEYWLCDGEYVHIIDRNDKKCLKVQLPPQMRGQQIHLSPLPFLFGVKAQELQNRYWIRPIAPPPGNTDVWLETYPKRPDDAGNYSRVQIILDPTEVLPKGLVVFLPNYRPDQQHREVYEFSSRDKDWNVLDQLKDKMFKDEFIPKTLPKDWEIVVEPYQAPQDTAPRQAAAGPLPGQPVPGQAGQRPPQAVGGPTTNGLAPNRPASAATNPAARVAQPPAAKASR
jgi:TIGR03009 family protein